MNKIKSLCIVIPCVFLFILGCASSQALKNQSIMPTVASSFPEFNSFPLGFDYNIGMTMVFQNNNVERGVTLEWLQEKGINFGTIDQKPLQNLSLDIREAMKMNILSQAKTLGIDAENVNLLIDALRITLTIEEGVQQKIADDGMSLREFISDLDVVNNLNHRKFAQSFLDVHNSDSTVSFIVEVIKCNKGSIQYSFDKKLLKQGYKSQNFIKLANSIYGGSNLDLQKGNLTVQQIQTPLIIAFRSIPFSLNKIKISLNNIPGKLSFATSQIVEWTEKGYPATVKYDLNGNPCNKYKVVLLSRSQNDPSNEWMLQKEQITTSESGEFNAALIYGTKEKGNELSYFIKGLLINRDVSLSNDKPINISTLTEKQVKAETEQQVTRYDFDQKSFDLAKKDLIKIIKQIQRKWVRISLNEYDCYTWENKDAFDNAGRLKEIVANLSNNGQFLAVVNALRRLAPKYRDEIYDAGEATFQPTWGEMGYISSAGQTDAGQQVQREIASAIVGLARELIGK